MNAYAVAAADKIDIAALLEQLTAVRLREAHVLAKPCRRGIWRDCKCQCHDHAPISRWRSASAGTATCSNSWNREIVEVVRQELRYHLEAEELAMAERPSIQLPVGLPAFAAAGNTPPTGSAA